MMEYRSRHPTMTRLTRILCVILSSVGIVVLAPASFVAWQTAASGNVGFATFLVVLLTTCVLILLRALFAPAKPHSARTLMLFSMGLIAAGVAGGLAVAAALVFHFGRPGDLALTLAGAIGCAQTGFHIRSGRNA